MSDVGLCRKLWCQMSRSDCSCTSHSQGTSGRVVMTASKGVLTVRPLYAVWLLTGPSIAIEMNNLKPSHSGNTWDSTSICHVRYMSEYLLIDFNDFQPFLYFF